MHRKIIGLAVLGVGAYFIWKNRNKSSVATVNVVGAKPLGGSIHYPVGPPPILPSDTGKGLEAVSW